jgi:hypothetical protein
MGLLEAYRDVRLSLTDVTGAHTLELDEAGACAGRDGRVTSTS